MLGLLDFGDKITRVAQVLVKILARRTMVEGEIWNTVNNINQCNGFF